MQKKQKTAQVVFAHVTIGLQLALTILAGVIGGNWLDNRFKTSPVFLAICTTVAMIVGFYHLIKQLTSPSTKDGDKTGENRRKWN